MEWTASNVQPSEMTIHAVMLTTEPCIRDGQGCKLVRRRGRIRGWGGERRGEREDEGRRVGR